MITAVQRKTEYCGARMAAVGSWEIGILERHFRVSASSSCYQPTTNNPVFRLLVPWPFPPLPQPWDAPPFANQIFPDTFVIFLPLAIFLLFSLFEPLRDFESEFLKRDAGIEKINLKYRYINWFSSKQREYNDISKKSFASPSILKSNFNRSI